MSQNTKQAALPVNSYEQNTLSLSRNSFLKTVKKLHKHLKNEPKNEIKLSDIQEALAKALGNRNWRELDEKFQNSHTPVIISQEVKNGTFGAIKPEQSSGKNLINFLKSLNAPQIAKLLTFSIHIDNWGDNWGENAQKLSNILSILILQTIDRITISQLYDLLRRVNLYQIFEDVTNYRKESKIFLTDANEDEEEYNIQLTFELKKAIVSYIQTLPNHENINAASQFDLVTREHHGYSVTQIVRNFHIMNTLNEDFIIFKYKWLEAEKSDFKNQFIEEYKLESDAYIHLMEKEWQDNSWLFHLTPIVRLIERRRKTSNWSYQYEEVNTITFSDLFYLYVTNVIEDKNMTIKKTIQNTLDNLQTYKDLIHKTIKKYE